MAVNAALATIFLLLDLPALVLTWLLLASKGTRPFLVRHASSSSPPGGLLRFNVRDDNWTSRHIRNLGFDLGPAFFDVVSGRIKFIEGIRAIHQLARERAEFKQPLRTIQSIRIAGLFVLATALLWIAWQPL